MSVKIFKIQEYDHLAEISQFERVSQIVLEQDGRTFSQALLIGNYNIEGVELDALLITDTFIAVLEFKNWGGSIVATENGNWTSNGLTIEGGAGGKSPYAQIRLNRSRTTSGLRRLLSKPDLNELKGVIIMGQDAEIDDHLISDQVKRWMRICDNRSLSEVLSNCAKKTLFTSSEMVEMPELLGIQRFIINDIASAETISANLPTPAYGQESALSFFDELALLEPEQGIKSSYQELRRVFRAAVDQKTTFNTLRLNGLYAKMDYLSREYHIKKSIFKAANNTRDRLKKLSTFSDNELQKCFPIDLKAVCDFIHAVYDEPIPEDLASKLPKEVPVEMRSTVEAPVYRIIVSQWDDKYIYGTSEDIAEDEVRICYSPGEERYGGDWKYIETLLYQDCQINIVRPRKNNGIYFPELIILDPDYLIDVSTITKCFDVISDNPMHNLFKKIRVFDASPATMLGNFASQLLDEEVHNEPEENSYEESFRNYIRNNAFTALTTLQDTDVSDIHSKGEVQKRNIRNALDDALTNMVGDYRNDKVMLEPSFYSEMLGVQGRMDFLQLDYRVLIEQKSGKAENEFLMDKRGESPKQQKEHYIQLILYRAILHYNYELENGDISSFLLYSKYSNGLIGLGSAPQLLFEAIKMRNRLVRYENMYCLGGLSIMLEDYIKDPDKICKPEMREGKWWQNYKRKDYVNLLTPFQNASELELSYYYRFMTFIENEHVLAKVGTREKENSGFAAKWLDTLDDKHQAGNIYDKLTLTAPDLHHAGSVSQLVFTLDSESPTDMSNFRTGDIVIAYSYDKDKEPDARKTMVFRGTIINLEPEIITVKLNAAQSDKYVFTRDTNKYWAIEHDFMESSFNSLYRGMTLFVAAPQARKDLLLLQRQPDVDRSLQLKGDYQDFNELALRVKQARDLFLIIGPPGTGKTSYGMLYTLQEELLEPDSNVLIMSYTNRAVDEICSKLVENDINFIRLGHIHSCDPAYRNYLLDSKLSAANSLEEMRSIIRSTHVFVGTTTSLNGSNFGIFKLKHFDLAIIDEASQILEPHLVGLFAAMNDNRPAIQKFVMIGDHKQLPAVVQQTPELSAVADQALNDICLTDCRLSLFERLLKKYGKDSSVTYMLTKQGRMHHDIALFPNYSFYHNKLQEVPVQHQNEQLPLSDTEANGIDQLLATRRIAFIAVPYPKKTESDKVNITEAEMIAATVVRAYLREKGHFDPLRTIGVIVPYRNQISTIRNCIAKYGYDDLKDITIDTVERYQGSQREYIIYGFTIRKLYQLNFLTSNVFEEEGAIIDRKLNVAMTRARKHLIMFGNPQLLSENITFYKLIEFVRSRHGYFDIRPESFVDGMFTVPQNEKEPIDLSKASFSVSPAFRTAFAKHVLAPIKDASPAWPDLVLGRDMTSNLEIINYGRVNFSNQLPMFEEDAMSPDEQVLLYCYYIMRQHYCSSANIYKSMSVNIKAQMEAARGNVQLIDIGCGPATCGLAFAEQFLDAAPKMRYNGIDISVAMRNMGEQLIKSTLDDRLRYRFFESFNELNDMYWNAISETPSLVIFNLSYFFSNVDPAFSEALANRICEIIRKKPVNRYLFIIQHSETDYKLNSFNVFKRVILSGNVYEVKSEKTEFTYTLSSERTLPFHYDIWESK